MTIRTNPPLQVVGFIGTRRGEADRGPQVSLRSSDAQERFLVDGELVYLSGPRRQELAVLKVDDSVPKGGVVLRDIVGVAVSEIVRVRKR